MPDLAIEIDKDKLHDFCRRWKITEFALFGSATRPQEFREDSDVDVLVSFAPDVKWGLFDLVHAQDELSQIFGRKVDLVERRLVEQSDNRFRRRSILNSMVLLDVA
jgi:predicted nucleotidyltransferase